MSALAVTLDIAGAVRDAQRAFEEFGVDRFPRAVQYALTGVAIDGVNRFRREIPNVWKAPNRATRDALRYAVDKDILGQIASVGEASAAVFVQDNPSVWLKYSFGEGTQTRPAGDVGIEAYFSDQMSVRVPVNENLSKTGFSRLGSGRKVPTRDVKRVADLAAVGYDRNTAGGTRGSGTWGAFEVRPGDTKALNGYAYRPGIWARPPRVVAAGGRKKLAKAIRAGKVSAPTTSFNRRSGQSVTVPKVVNADVPRLLFLSTPKAEYQPVATPSWERSMEAAAGTLADRLASELADRLGHKSRRGR